MGRRGDGSIPVPLGMGMVRLPGSPAPLDPHTDFLTVLASLAETFDDLN